MKLIFSIILISITLISSAHATPSPTAKSLLWEHSGVRVAGFYLYWTIESEEIPRIYDNSRRIKINDATKRSVIVLGVLPDSKDGMCFKITAYNFSEKESPFSDEACGYFGFEAVIQFRIE